MGALLQRCCCMDTHWHSLHAYSHRTPLAGLLSPPSPLRLSQHTHAFAPRDMTGQRNIYMVREGVKYSCSPDQIDG